MLTKYNWYKKDEVMREIISEVSKKLDVPEEHVAFFYDDFCKSVKERLKNFPFTFIKIVPLGNISPYIYGIRVSMVNITNGLLRGNTSWKTYLKIFPKLVSEHDHLISEKRRGRNKKAWAINRVKNS